jgi:hypothetical protein
MEQADAAEERRQAAALALVEGLSKEGSHGGHMPGPYLLSLQGRK